MEQVMAREHTRRGGRRVKLPKDRFDYSPMVERRRWTLPKGARIAVWTIVNVEEWDIEKAMARQYLPTPQGVTVVPDVPNWAWEGTGAPWPFRCPTPRRSRW